MCVCVCVCVCGKGGGGGGVGGKGKIGYFFLCRTASLSSVDEPTQKFCPQTCIYIYIYIYTDSNNDHLRVAVHRKY